MSAGFLYLLNLHSDGFLLNETEYSRLCQYSKEERRKIVVDEQISLTSNDDFFLDLEIPFYYYNLAVEARKRMESSVERFKEIVKNLLTVK